jgi:hypothetical protein
VSAVPAVLDSEQGLTLQLYERGCALLERCIAFDETKYWDSLADAAAAWGKIHKSDRVEQLARALKLHAYRRLGEIAELQQPTRPAQPKAGTRTGEPLGRPGGPVSWLQAQGMTRQEGTAACTLAGMDAKAFETIANAKRPPSPQSIQRAGRTAWRVFYSRASIAAVAHHTQALSPARAAQLEGMRDPAKEQRKARHLAQWFTQFADALEKRQQ